jgi:Glyceraldehyde 3-phosphate dehydrogenase, C-terminal domain/Cupin
MTTDVLSEVLRAVRLRGAVYFDFELTAPFALEAPAPREIVGKILPLLKGRLDGMAIRVPVPDGSIVDLSVRLRAKPKAAEINAAVRAAAEGPMKRIVEYSEAAGLLRHYRKPPLLHLRCPFDPGLGGRLCQDRLLVRQRVGLFDARRGPDRPPRRAPIAVANVLIV